MRAAAAAAVLLLALGAAHAQRMDCDGTFDKVSAVCCLGSGHRRLQIASLLTCQKPRSCSRDCAAVLPRYLRACARTMRIPRSWRSFCSGGGSYVRHARARLRAACWGRGSV